MKTKRQVHPPKPEATITVYPTKASALNVAHPSRGKLLSSGSQWPNDGFTYRMLFQRIATENQRLAYAPEVKVAQPDPAPVADQAED